MHVRKKLLILLTQLIQFIDQQIQLKKHQTVKKNLSIYISTKYLPIETMFVYLNHIDTYIYIYIYIHIYILYIYIVYILYIHTQIYTIYIDR